MRAILMSLKNGSSITAACEAANISHSTYFNWCHGNERFGELTDRAKQSRISIVEDALFKSAKNGSTNAQRYYLNNRKGHDWKEDPIVINVQRKTSIFQEIHHHYSENGYVDKKGDNGKELSTDSRGLLEIIK